MGGASVVCCFVLKDAKISRSYSIAKWSYCALFTLITIVTWVLRDYSEQVGAAVQGGSWLGDGRRHYVLRGWFGAIG